MKLNTKFTGRLAAGLCSFTFMAALSSAQELPAPEAPTVPPTFEDVASIIANNCGYCHTGGADALAGISFDTEEEVVERAALAYAAIESGFMPYGDPEFRTSPDGIKLLAYLKSQIPAEPEPKPQPLPPQTPKPVK